MRKKENLQNPQKQSLNTPTISDSFFANKFRIVTDKCLGYQVQMKRWWVPFWIQCDKLGMINSFSSIEKAKDWVKNGRPIDEGFVSKVVENLQNPQKQTLNTPVISGSYINTEIYKCLNKISNSVGETITEYHWREFCELMKMMEDEKMVVITWK